ncbi:Re/Si-specific NAD(P)(+) transhydrogenase subunit alpha [Phormidium sp. CLA17]|uniref:Re/Si-specific NAD(P)(+) transhydrogenase subunit alpha n=1 Tax=Leptolyngbya sp. Cla-17 TaxID=2803751 RepID=UPI001491474E|nr:Re/Si-specific NAD(P)(+) transhydrogenase subunit alpha [Leptolyngbya sp. Cla-17]MBM0741929.1 Re/Si-specific NAD(P)(+) transhydrogenase subunit alpha [Leptolyngbya sp. Cla-17]
MKIGIPKEIYPGECRVAATPDTARRLQKLGFEILVEANAGSAANFPDEAYVQANCTIVSETSTVWAADVVLKVRPPALSAEVGGSSEVACVREGGTVISFIYPAQNRELLDALAARKATVLAMDAIPRISRAQKMDALSSMANIAGYRAVIEAASKFDRFFPGQITAAGKVPPTKVMIIGAGVAGLAAIGAAKNLGAIVRAFDTRPAVKEQVESMGAEFLELEFEEDGTGQGGYAKVMSEEFIKAEMALFAEQAKDVDIIITTALIPGIKAPVLITQAMVDSMKPGSVVVDLAAEQGGNCEVTKPSEVYRYNGVTIIGLTDLPSRMAQQASQLYGTNLCHLLDELGGNDNYTVDFENEVVRGATVVREGEITWSPNKPPAPPPKPVESAQAATQSVPAKAAPMPTAPISSAATEPNSQKPGKKSSPGSSKDFVWLALIGLALLGIGVGAPPSFLSHLTVFVLAIFVGWQVIWNVSPALHTPLMSVTNAISGIIIIGGILQLPGSAFSPTAILGAIAILIGTINIAGGFLVTQRMLKMFQR